MGLLDGIGKAIVEQYLRDQADDFKAWFIHGLQGIDPGEIRLAELADIALEALRNTLEHGSPPS